MQVPQETLAALEDPTPRKRRKRRCKYPRTDPRHWVAVYERNGREGRARYAGIPPDMHEPLLAIKRASRRASTARSAKAVAAPSASSRRRLMGYVVAGCLMCASLAFTTLVGDAARRHDQALEQRIEQLESAQRGDTP